MFPLKMYVARPTKGQLRPYLNAFISCTVFVTAVYGLIHLKWQCLKEKFLNG